MRHLFLVIALFGTVPGLGSSLDSIQEHKVCIPGTWSHLTYGRRLYEAGENAAAARVFSSLYQDHHNIFVIPFLQELRDHLTPELWDEIHFIRPTTMSMEFKRNNLPLSMNKPDSPNEQRMLGLLFDKERTDKVQEFILKNIHQITYVNMQDHWRNLDAHMGGGDSVFDILGKSTADKIWQEHLPFLMQGAKKGDIMFQHNLSIGFSFGKGLVAQDLQNAFFWNKKAADQLDENIEKAWGRLKEFRSGGVTPGTIYFNLAMLYLKNQDIDKAIDYFEKAIEHQIDHAQTELLRLLSDSSKQEHVQKYKKWLKKLGGNENLCKLAILRTRSGEEFAQGLASLKDFAGKGFLNAQFELEILINKKHQSKSTKNKKAIKGLLQKACDHIHELDLQQKVRLVELLLNHEIAKLNLDVPFGNFCEILLQGQSKGINCQFALGGIFEANQRFEEAAAYYQTYLDTGEEDYRADALNNLGYLYMYGKGVEVNYPCAISLFDEAIQKGHLLSMYNRGLMYHTGLGGKNLLEAVRLYQTPAEQGDTDALYHLGLAYIELSDYDKAHVWSKKAADQGNLSARHNLIYLFVSGHPSPDQTNENIKEALFQNVSDGSSESQIILAGVFLGASRQLGIEKDVQKAKEILLTLTQNQDIRTQILARVLLNRLEDGEDSSADEGTDEPVDQKEVTLVQMKPVKVKKESRRERKESRDIQKALKRKQFFDELKENRPAEKSRNFENQAHHFTDHELKILEEFAQNQGPMKEREFEPILKILGAKPTKSGYVIDGMVGGHRTHGSDTVNKCAVKELKSYVENIMEGKKK